MPAFKQQTFTSDADPYYKQRQLDRLVGAAQSIAGIRDKKRQKKMDRLNGRVQMIQKGIEDGTLSADSAVVAQTMDQYASIEPEQAEIMRQGFAAQEKARFDDGAIDRYLGDLAKQQAALREQTPGMGQEQGFQQALQAMGPEAFLALAPQLKKMGVELPEQFNFVKHLSPKGRGVEAGARGLLRPETVKAAGVEADIKRGVKGEDKLLDLDSENMRSARSASLQGRQVSVSERKQSLAESSAKAKIEKDPVKAVVDEVARDIELQSKMAREDWKDSGPLGGRGPAPKRIAGLAAKKEARKRIILAYLQRTVKPAEVEKYLRKFEAAGTVEQKARLEQALAAGSGG